MGMDNSELDNLMKEVFTPLPCSFCHGEGTVSCEKSECSRKTMWCMPHPCAEGECKKAYTACQPMPRRRLAFDRAFEVKVALGQLRGETQHLVTRQSQGEDVKAQIEANFKLMSAAKARLMTKFNMDNSELDNLMKEVFTPLPCSFCHGEGTVSCEKGECSSKTMWCMPHPCAEGECKKACPGCQPMPRRRLAFDRAFEVKVALGQLRGETQHLVTRQIQGDDVKAQIEANFKLMSTAKARLMTKFSMDNSELDNLIKEVFTPLPCSFCHGEG